MDFDWDAHAGNFLRSLAHPGLPAQYLRADTQRVTLAYFCVVGLDLLGKLGTCSEAGRAAVIDWVLAQFVLPGDTGPQWQRCGFRGGSFGGKHFVNAGQRYSSSTCSSTAKLADAPDLHKNKIDRSSVVRREDEMDEGNLAMTYSALATLITLEDDLADVDGQAIVRALGSLQQEDGSFRASPSDRTCDLRFTYCACAVSTILGSWDGVDRPKAADYIEKCYGFDGGIGLAPGRESCAGPTFCAVASMKLLGTLDTIAATRREGLLEWCVNRQGTGFQGRPNKVDDCCCSFWIGATLALLDGLHLVDKSRARDFHISCQNKVLGGFAKAPGEPPDLLHSFYSLCWLSLSKEDGLEAMDAALGITRRAGARVMSGINVRATH